jgi:hypothetical protein
MPLMAEPEPPFKDTFASWSKHRHKMKKQQSVKKKQERKVLFKSKLDLGPNEPTNKLIAAVDIDKK